MRRIFIPGFKNKYSINDAGEVWSHYKHLRNGRKVRCDKMIAIRKGTAGSPLVSLWLEKQSSMGVFYVRTLMKQLFDIAPPDNYHFYDLVPKDGAWNNCSAENLVWRIRFSTRSWRYYPQPFYNKNGDITHKMCCDCGVKKQISDFFLNPPREKNTRERARWRYTYSNNCTPCSSKKAWSSIMASPAKHRRHLENCSRWRKLKRGRAYYRKYESTLRINLSDRYIKTSLSQQSSLCRADVTPQMINIQRKSLIIKRKLKTKSI